MIARSIIQRQPGLNPLLRDFRQAFGACITAERPLGTIARRSAIVGCQRSSIARGFENPLVLQGQAKRLNVWGALAGLLHVGDGLIPFPSQTGLQVADSYRRRAADAGGAVEINRVAFG